MAKDVIEPEYQSVIEEAKARFRAASVAEDRQRELELDDLHFCESGSQWPPEIKRDREAEGRPCLEVDRINPFIHQVCNEYRQARPQPQVNPCDSGASKETAEVLQGMIRHIMYLSNGDTAVDTAFESMTRIGRGYARVLTDYCDDMSFDQDVIVSRIPNPHMVYIDPSSTSPDGSDMNWAFVGVDMSRDAFRLEYPDAKLSDMSTAEWKSLGDDDPEWMNGSDGCRVMEYFRKVLVPTKLAKLADGRVIEKKDATEFDQIVDERDGHKTKIVWYKMTANEILDTTEWPGKWIPIIPFYGSELIIEGKRIFSGLVRSAKDPARHYNYMKSAQAEAIALAPKAPIIAAKGSLGSGEMRSAWKNINRRAVAVAEYDAYDSQQRQMPPPQRLMTDVNIAGITEAMMGAADDLKATTGMYDASLGNRSQASSGVAIKSLQQQGSTGNFHFVDNAARSIRHLGRILVDLFPKIYDTQRVVRCVKPDETVDLKTINGPSGETDEHTGVERIYDLKTGTYDVVVSVGPSYQTKRMENLSLLESLLQGPMGQLLSMQAPDLVVGMMDFAIAPQLQERLKKGLPPQFQEKPKGEMQLPPEVQQQMQQMGQRIQTDHEVITQAMKALDVAEAKLANKTLELESRERIAELQARTELIKLEMQQLGTAGLAVLQEELAGITSRLSQLGGTQPIPDPSQDIEQMEPSSQEQGQPEEQQPTGEKS